MLSWAATLGDPLHRAAILEVLVSALYPETDAKKELAISGMTLTGTISLAPLSWDWPARFGPENQI